MSQFPFDRAQDCSHWYGEVTRDRLMEVGEARYFASGLKVFPV
jgi:hypothetical protein